MNRAIRRVQRGFSEGLATTKNRDASSTRETIARAFLTSFPNFERVARANGDAVDEDVRDLAHLARLAYNVIGGCTLYVVYYPP